MSLYLSIWHEQNEGIGLLPAQDCVGGAMQWTTFMECQSNQNQINETKQQKCLHK